MNWGLKMPRDAKRKMSLPFIHPFRWFFLHSALVPSCTQYFFIVVLTTYLIHKNKSSTISLKDSKFKAPFVTSDQSITCMAKFFIMWQIPNKNTLEINNIL